MEHKRKHTDRYCVIVMARHIPPKVNDDWTLEAVYDSFFYEADDPGYASAQLPVTVWVFDKKAGT